MAIFSLSIVAVIFFAGPLFLANCHAFSCRVKIVAQGMENTERHDSIRSRGKTRVGDRGDLVSAFFGMAVGEDRGAPRRQDGGEVVCDAESFAGLQQRCDLILLEVGVQSSIGVDGVGQGRLPMDLSRRMATTVRAARKRDHRPWRVPRQECGPSSTS